MPGLAQTSFEDRRKYEWKINFGMWTALGAVGYFCKEKGVTILERDWIPYVVAGLIVIQLLSFIGIAEGNSVDKDWKHYYMKRAEGKPTEPPSKRLWKPDFRQAVWALHNTGVTGALAYLVCRLIAKAP